MTIQTAVLIETLTALGAEVRWASCNILMQKERCIAAVVEDHVGKTAIWPLKNAVCEFPVF